MDEQGYVALLLLLNAVGQAGYLVQIKKLVDLCAAFVPRASVATTIDSLNELNMVRIEHANEERRRNWEFTEDDHIELWPSFPYQLCR